MNSANMPTAAAAAEVEPDSDSSDGIILPAITVPPNYTMTIPQEDQNDSNDNVVKICIDSPSEEEPSVKTNSYNSTKFNSTIV